MLIPVLWSLKFTPVSYFFVLKQFNIYQACSLVEENEFRMLLVRFMKKIGTKKVQSLRFLLLYYILTIKQMQMKMQKKDSLMQRRKKSMSTLQSTIKSLSVVQKELKYPHRRSHLKQFYSAGEISYEHQLSLPDGHQGAPDPEFNPRGSDMTIPSSQEDQRQIGFDQKYRMGQKMGEGAHGVVRKCYQKNNDKVYAVKTLQTQDEHFRSLRTNFIFIKRLKHDSIIKYKALYINTKQRICHQVMEYFKHPPLKPGLPQEQLRAAFYQLLDALSYLHKQHICHRDIKPDNILFDKANKKIKIIDFGVSKNLKMRGRYEEMLTNTGTYYYKAPQMFSGAGYSQAVDSWAAGITLYEMVAGVTPFASVYHSQTIENILHKKLQFDQEEFYNYNPLIKDLIMHLLIRNPKERMTCEQAKKHLWFFSRLNDDELMKSAGPQNQKSKESDKKALTTFLLKRKSSLIQGNADKNKNEGVSKTDKQLMKSWLQIINEDTSSNHTENVAFDFVESQEENDQFTFHMPKKTIQTQFLKNKDESVRPKNKSSYQ